MSYYDFARRRQPLTPKGYFLRRQKQRDEKLGYRGCPVRVEQIVHPDNLYQSYQEMRQEGGQAPGVDRLTYDDLSPSEVGQQVRSLAKSVLAGTYRPQQTRPAQIPKPKGGTRTLQIATLFDRVLGKALYRAWSPYWETMYLPCSYGFRPCRNPWRMLADLEATVVCERRPALAIDDIISAYDNVPIALVIQLFDKAMHSPDFKMTEEDKQRSLRLVDTVLRGHDQHRTIGLHQGNPFSPLALNVLLHDLVDAPLSDASAIPSWFRYADNVVYAAQDVSEGRTVLERVRSLLQSQNLTLKQQDGVANLARGETTQVLGYTLWLREGQVGYGLGMEALNQLTRHLSAAHETENPPAAATHRLLGWMDSVGPAFEDGVVTEALLIAVRSGFRSICPPDQAYQRARDSWQRWLATRERAYRRRGLPIRG